MEVLLTEDIVRRLAVSTQAFYNRFDVTPAAEDAIRVFQEEVRELIEAVRQRDAITHIGEEAADVIVTVLGVCFAAGLNIDDLIQQIEVVMRKNDAKTTNTHAVIEGKIRRKN
jgi:NTP pyrophosphatase (non-canonical NTP hydrolase)